MESSSPFDTADIMVKRSQKSYTKARELFVDANRKVMSTFCNEHGKINTVDLVALLAALQASATDTMLASYEAGAISYEDGLELITTSMEGFKTYVEESNASGN